MHWGREGIINVSSNCNCDLWEAGRSHVTPVSCLLCLSVSESFLSDISISEYICYTLYVLRTVQFHTALLYQSVPIHLRLPAPAHNSHGLTNKIQQMQVNTGYCRRLCQSHWGVTSVWKQHRSQDTFCQEMSLFLQLNKGFSYFTLETSVCAGLSWDTHTVLFWVLNSA